MVFLHTTKKNNPLGDDPRMVAGESGAAPLGLLHCRGARHFNNSELSKCLAPA
ncbi:hypothetical protein [Lentibacillus cibarius]|uniref:hypothetical protein n=1 Tax=Lentibacillus cibarius TaxID=2583219 RepID=UPI00163D94E8|nr:hypothetical protein [Lentibacillus cibarius]